MNDAVEEVVPRTFLRLRSGRSGEDVVELPVRLGLLGSRVSTGGVTPGPALSLPDPGLPLEPNHVI